MYSNKINQIESYRELKSLKVFRPENYIDRSIFSNRELYSP